MKNMQAVAFSDESKYNQGRYRGIGLVTCLEDDAQVIRDAMATKLAESKVNEFKWEKLRNAKYRFAAEKISDIAFSFAICARLRIDVLIWDVEDSRHRVPGRDDVRNFQIMYHKLFKNVFRKRWPSGCTWKLFPDEHDEIRWDDIRVFLDAGCSDVCAEEPVWSPESIESFVKHEYGIAGISPKRSHDEPLIQLADLFVGMAVYSRDDYQKCMEWLKQLDCKSDLFGREPNPEIAFASADRERLRFLCEFDKKCKSNKMSISLKSSKGLQTRSPSSPLNFWFYKPQHEMDQAPTTAAYDFRVTLGIAASRH